MQTFYSAVVYSFISRQIMLAALLLSVFCSSAASNFGQDSGAATVASGAAEAAATGESTATDSQEQTAGNAQPPAAETVAAESSQSSTGKSTEQTKQTATVAEKSWIELVDAAAGKYVVGPMSSVLFFDFGTKNYLGASVPFVVIWLLCGGVFLTLKMGFINVRGFKHGLDLVRGKYDDKSKPGEVSHFQALASALSGTVGLGNIAGVAVAIGVGGPGATFWMILCGLLGMTSKFAECSLAVMYRRVGKDGTVLGGPMVYLKEGLGQMGLGKLGAILSVVFAILCVGGSFGGGNSYQIVQSLNAISSDPNLGFLKENPWIYGLLMVIAVGVVILGGIKSIGQTAEKIVPFMCVAYVSMALVIIGANYANIPAAIGAIIQGAFTPEGVTGGFLGVMVQGVKRAVFSNEAGAGSAAIAHSAAKTDRPMSEGFVALLEPFIDTVVVCTITALMIVVSGMYNDPTVKSLADTGKGAQITLLVVTQNPSLAWFKYVLYVAVVMFAYSTCISWSYYGERCFVYLFGPKSSLFYKCLFLTFTFLGSIVSPQNILEFSDMLILSMAVPNLIGVFLMSGVIKRALDQYWSDLKDGKMTKH